MLRGRLQFAAERENIWWGVSVEDRKYGLPRIEHLRQAPAKVRFLSIEPLLEDHRGDKSFGHKLGHRGRGKRARSSPHEEENGWFRFAGSVGLIGVPFFFKQWGGVRKVKHGRELDGRTYDEYPRRVVTPVPDRTRCAAFAENFLNSFRGMVSGRSLVQVGA